MKKRVELTVLTRVDKKPVAHRSIPFTRIALLQPDIKIFSPYVKIASFKDLWHFHREYPNNKSGKVFDSSLLIGYTN